MKSRLLPAIAACSVAGVLGTSAVLAHVGAEYTAPAGPLPPAALSLLGPGLAGFAAARRRKLN